MARRVWKTGFGQRSIRQRATAGYGLFMIRHGEPMLAHRFAYTLLVGPLDPTKEIDHLCRNRLCIRHLDQVSHRENVLRGLAPMLMRARRRGQTHCIRGHPFDRANTFFRPDGRRRCRICRRNEDVKSRQRPSRQVYLYAYRRRPEVKARAAARMRARRSARGSI